MSRIWSLIPYVAQLEARERAAQEARLRAETMERERTAQLREAAEDLRAEREVSRRLNEKLADFLSMRAYGRPVFGDSTPEPAPEFPTAVRDRFVTGSDLVRRQTRDFLKEMRGGS